MNTYYGVWLGAPQTSSLSLFVLLLPDYSNRAVKHVTRLFFLFFLNLLTGCLGDRFMSGTELSRRSSGSSDLFTLPCLLLLIAFLWWL